MYAGLVGRAPGAALTIPSLVCVSLCSQDAVGAPNHRRATHLNEVTRSAALPRDRSSSPAERAPGAASLALEPLWSPPELRCYFKSSALASRWPRRACRLPHSVQRCYLPGTGASAAFRNPVGHAFCAGFYISGARALLG